MKHLIILVTFILLSTSGFASEHKDSVTVKVKGMVCAFCAQGIEKNFNKLDSIESTHVDLDKMEVHLKLHKDMTIDDNKIKAVVEGAGFSFVGAQ
ncbi:MAG: heavy-metal-associated domain-containing protein [Bdellovibrionales bacterium]|nr:heavy-metal-associated domain-containing protein [Bdellovibrionales bacterium]